jgi:hypothetical protein
MTLSNPTDTQPAVKQTRKRGRSATEKRHSVAQRVQRHRSTATNAARVDSFQRSNDGCSDCAPATTDGCYNSCIGTATAPPLAAMRTPVPRQSDAPLPAAMTDSCAMLLTAPRRTTARYSLACKGAVLGIPPPAAGARTRVYC